MQCDCVLFSPQRKLSKVIPLVSLIHRAVASCEHQGSSLATQLAQQCQRRFSGIEGIHCLVASTFLDVRFKHLGFRDKDNVDILKKCLHTEMQEVYQPGQSAPTLTVSSTPTVSSASGPSTSESSQSPAPAGPAATKGGIWTDFDIQVLSGQHHQSASSDVLIELRQYSEEKLIPRDKDPLVWWQEHEQTFPSLSRVAVRYLGIVAFSHSNVVLLLAIAASCRATAIVKQLVLACMPAMLTFLIAVQQLNVVEMEDLLTWNIVFEFFHCCEGQLLQLLAR
uniref:HAT C-terminal dimerisation domain-containing protein n=1 Tax=Oreochromis aureus TaxID=47969 RepID=A0A668S243_OREAU